MSLSTFSQYLFILLFSITFFYVYNKLITSEKNKNDNCSHIIQSSRKQYKYLCCLEAIIGKQDRMLNDKESHVSQTFIYTIDQFFEQLTDSFDEITREHNCFRNKIHMDVNELTIIKSSCFTLFCQVTFKLPKVQSGQCTDVSQAQIFSPYFITPFKEN